MKGEIVGYCVAAGMTIGLGGLVSCLSSRGSLAPEDIAQLDGLLIADAHAHPYQLHGSGKYDGSTPTTDMMKQAG